MSESKKLHQILDQGSTVEERLVNYYTSDIGASYRLNMTNNGGYSPPSQ